MIVTHILGQAAHKAHCHAYPFALNKVRPCIFELTGQTRLAGAVLACERTKELGCTSSRFASCISLREFCRATRVSVCVNQATSGVEVVIDGQCKVSQTRVIYC